MGTRNDTPRGGVPPKKMTKLGALSLVGTITAREMQKVINQLFPTHPLRTDVETEINDSNIPAFPMGELEVAVSSHKEQKNTRT
ncbi:hypothetical protein J437_LFUL000667 [Ladona fulva]|uniref:Uncharacterized protein n=1 Tax=Ladona fulva TaxID=123851 RepID=A0A8K0K3D3_LADFU|nr:hypothetical protein J437_LFUL000667 [Ladona fulva]